MKQQSEMSARTLTIAELENVNGGALEDITIGIRVPRIRITRRKRP